MFSASFFYFLFGFVKDLLFTNLSMLLLSVLIVASSINTESRIPNWRLSNVTIKFGLSVLHIPVLELSITFLWIYSFVTIYFTVFILQQLAVVPFSLYQSVGKYFIYFTWVTRFSDAATSFNFFGSLNNFSF